MFSRSYFIMVRLKYLKSQGKAPRHQEKRWDDEPKAPVRNKSQDPSGGRQRNYYDDESDDAQGKRSHDNHMRRKQPDDDSRGRGSVDRRSEDNYNGSGSGSVHRDKPAGRGGVRLSREASPIHLDEDYSRRDRRTVGREGDFVSKVEYDELSALCAQLRRQQETLQVTFTSRSRKFLPFSKYDSFDMCIGRNL